MTSSSKKANSLKPPDPSKSGVSSNSFSNKKWFYFVIEYISHLGNCHFAFEKEHRDKISLISQSAKLWIIEYLSILQAIYSMSKFLLEMIHRIRTVTKEALITRRKLFIIVINVSVRDVLSHYLKLCWVVPWKVLDRLKRSREKEIQSKLKIHSSFWSRCGSSSV